MLGRRIDNTIRTKRQGLLPQGRSKHIVDCQLGAGLMGDFGNSGDINNFKTWIGWTFQKENFGVGPQGCLPRDEIGAVHKCCFNTKPWQPFFDYIATRSEQSTCRYHMITRFELAHQRSCDSRHATGRSTGCFGTLKSGHARFEHGNSGI